MRCEDYQARLLEHLAGELDPETGDTPPHPHRFLLGLVVAGKTDVGSAQRLRQPPWKL